MRTPCHGSCCSRLLVANLPELGEGGQDRVGCCRSLKGPDRLNIGGKFFRR